MLSEQESTICHRDFGIHLLTLKGVRESRMVAYTNNATIIKRKLTLNTGRLMGFYIITGH